MHRITKFNLREQYNNYVDPRIIEIMEEKVKEYNELQEVLNGDKYNLTTEQMTLIKYQLEDLYLKILYSNPAGFNITARMTTNYRCLKNIYIQRKNHRLPEWR